MKNQKGIALIWVLLVGSILITISVSMAQNIVKESKMALNVEKSTQSYAYARSGVEYVLKRLEEEIDPTTITAESPIDLGNSNEINFSVSKSGDETTIFSEASYNGTSRKIEYKTKEFNLDTFLDEPDTVGTVKSETDPSLIAPASFSLQSDLWFERVGSNTYYFGMQGPSPDNDYIAAEIIPSSALISIVAKDKSGAIVPKVASEHTVDLATLLPSLGVTGTNVPYRLRIFLQYYEGSHASLTVKVRNDESNFTGGIGSGDCSKIVTLDLHNREFNDFSRLKLGYNIKKVDTVGDDFVWQYDDPITTNKVFLDSISSTGIIDSPPTLTVTKSRNGGTIDVYSKTLVTGKGIYCGGTCQNKYVNGETVSLAISILDPYKDYYEIQSITVTPAGNEISRSGNAINLRISSDTSIAIIFRPIAALMPTCSISPLTQTIAPNQTVNITMSTQFSSSARYTRSFSGPSIPLSPVTITPNSTVTISQVLSTEGTYKYTLEAANEVNDTVQCASTVKVTSAASGWIDIGKSFLVYKTDSESPSTYQWKTTNTPCVSLQCNTGLDVDFLSAFALVKTAQDFSLYPARNSCPTGGRLPYFREFSDMWAANSTINSLGGTALVSADYYWTGTELNSGQARAFYSGGSYARDKVNLARVRCVIDK